MAANIGKWAPGASYGPVLSQTDLYLLQTDLELHPILLGNDPAFSLYFDLSTGAAGGHNADSRDRDLAFTAKDEPATMPRVSQLIIITEQSPWCTIVKNERGVTMHDICQQLYKEYTDETISDAELSSIPPRLQEQIKRWAHTLPHISNVNSYGAYYTPGPPVATTTLKRIHWLREKRIFESLHKNDAYAASRLGFKAPNIFVLGLIGA